MTTARARAQSPCPGAPLGRAEVVAQVLESAADLFAERGPAATSIRDIAARSIGELQSRFPTMELLLESARARRSTDLDARLAAAHTIALQLGWCLFGDFLRASTGLEDLDDRTFARSVGSTVALIFDADGPPRA